MAVFVLCVDEIWLGMSQFRKGKGYRTKENSRQLHQPPSRGIKIGVWCALSAPE
jgi:hypothetical protein